MPLFWRRTTNNLNYSNMHTDFDHDAPDLRGLAQMFRACLIIGLLAFVSCTVTVVKCCAQTDFYSPFHFVVTTPEPGSKSITDIYHVSTHVVITDATISIGVDTEGGQRFNYAIQGTEREIDRVRYIITDGIIIHEKNAEGESVTWISSKFQWRLYSFYPKLVEIEN